MNDNEDHPALTDLEVAALSKETGATQEQIRQISALVGRSKASIVFQARSIAKRNQ